MKVRSRSFGRVVRKVKAHSSAPNADSSGSGLDSKATSWIPRTTCEEISVRESGGVGEEWRKSAKDVRKRSESCLKEW